MLDSDAWRVIREHGRLLRLSRGTVAAFEGEPATSALFVCRGALLVYRSTGDGVDVGIDVALPGDAFGLEDVLCGGETSASARATVGSDVYVLTTEQCRRLQRVDSVFSAFVNEYLLDRCLFAYGRVDWHVGPIHARLRALFEELHRRRRLRGEAALPFSQLDLANLVHASRQRVNPALRDLAERGLVLLRNGSVYLQADRQRPTAASASGSWRSIA